MVLRISAPHFVAGVLLDGRGYVVRFAPIVKYMDGWGKHRVKSYSSMKGWKVEELNDLSWPEVSLP